MTELRMLQLPVNLVVDILTSLDSVDVWQLWMQSSKRGAMQGILQPVWMSMTINFDGYDLGGWIVDSDIQHSDIYALSWCQRDLDNHDVSALSALTNLRSLSVSGSTYMDDASFLSSLIQLEDLVLNYFPKLIDISSLGFCTNIHSLSILRCGISDMGAIRHLSALSHLTLRNNRNMTCLDWISDLCYLTTLELDGFGYDGGSSIPSLAPLTNLTAMESLILVGISGIKSLSGLSRMTQLQTLELRSMWALDDISDIRNLSVHTVTLENCEALLDISSISSMTNLMRLYIVLGAPQPIEALSNLTRLRQLQFCVPGPLDLSYLTKLVNLKHLDLTGTEFYNIDTLDHIPFQLELGYTTRDHPELWKKYNLDSDW